MISKRGIRRADLPLSTRSDSRPVFWNATLENRERARVHLTFSRVKRSRLTFPSTSATTGASEWMSSTGCSSDFYLQRKKVIKIILGNYNITNINNYSKWRQRALKYTCYINLYRFHRCENSLISKEVTRVDARFHLYIIAVYNSCIIRCLPSKLSRTYRTRRGSNLQTDLYFHNDVLLRPIHWLY